MIEEIKKKLGEKPPPRLLIYSLAAIICVLLLLFLKNPSGDDVRIPDIPVDDIKPEATDYASELEDKLRLIVSEIDGVGKVSVMVTVSGSEEKIYAENISESDGRSDSETVIIGSKEALLKEIRRPEVTGVLIVCSGGDRAQVKEKVVNAVSTVLNIPTSKVYVTKSE